jgi:hypothetical protein
VKSPETGKVSLYEKAIRGLVVRDPGPGGHSAYQFRVEAFNVFNRAQYGMPSANLSSPLSFGVITTPVNQGATGSGTPRQFQLAVRVSF